MFIERSAAKIRLVRTLFVLLALLPCAGLAGWAAYRHSATHREELRREAERLLGVPVRIGSMAHVRPGAIRLIDCSLVSATGETAVAVPTLEVEAGADEVRLRVPEFSCSPAGAALLAGLGRSWLAEPVRFPRAWVIDIGSFSWTTSRVGDAIVGLPDEPWRATPLRIECVAAGGDRAVRVFTPTGRDIDADEIRVITHRDDSGRAGPRHELHAAVRRPVPWAVVQKLMEPAALASLPLGMAARLSGTIEASAGSGGGWDGTARGVIDEVDLATVGAGSAYRLVGAAAIAVDRLEWAGGRLTRLDAGCTAARGRVGQPLLDALVNTCGCRAGPAYRSLAREDMRPFDDLSLSVAIDRGGMRIRSGPARTGSLARLQGLSIIDEPADAVPLDRVAWLLAPAGGPAVPASPGSAWLLSLVPLPGSSPKAPVSGEAGGPRTGAAGQRSEF